MGRQIQQVWAFALEQLGPAGAVIAAAFVVALVVILWLAVLGMIATRAMRRHEASRPPQISPSLSPARRLELRRQVDTRIGIEAQRVVDLRSRR